MKYQVAKTKGGYKIQSLIKISVSSLWSRSICRWEWHDLPGINELFLTRKEAEYEVKYLSSLEEK